LAVGRDLSHVNDDPGPASDAPGRASDDPRRANDDPRRANDDPFFTRKAAHFPTAAPMTLWNQFTWNSGALWEPVTPLPVFPINPKPKPKRMKRQEYYPTRVEAQPEWLMNFADKLPTYAATLGISNTRRDAAVLDALWLAYVIGLWAADARAWIQTVTDTISAAERGTGAAPMELPEFTAPSLPPANDPLPATVPVPPGALDRIFKLVKDIKNAAGFTEAIGNDLRVIGAAESPDANPLPKFTLKVEQGSTCQCVTITFFKYGRTGVYIESRRNGGAWEFLASPVVSPHVDARPLLAANTPEIREYRMRSWEKGVPTGDWTDVAKVTVAP
jgi:hypothetical protein